VGKILEPAPGDDAGVKSHGSAQVVYGAESEGKKPKLNSFVALKFMHCAENFDAVK
jgi:hypothetical protein